MKKYIDIDFYCNKNLHALRTSRLLAKGQDEYKNGMRLYRICSREDIRGDIKPIKLLKCNAHNMVLRLIKIHFKDLKLKWVYGNCSMPWGYEFE